MHRLSIVSDVSGKKSKLIGNFPIFGNLQGYLPIIFIINEIRLTEKALIFYNYSLTIIAYNKIYYIGMLLASILSKIVRHI